MLRRLGAILLIPLVAESFGLLVPVLRHILVNDILEVLEESG